MIRMKGQCGLGSIVTKSFSAIPKRWAGTNQANVVRKAIRGRNHFSKYQPCGRWKRSFATETDQEDKDKTRRTVEDVRTTKELLQNLLTQLQSPPNVITTLRILSAPYLSHLILTERYELAFYGCFAAGFSDVLDGYLARQYQMSTVLGTYLDPLADKVIINVLAASLWHNGILPTPLVTLWLARDVAFMAVTYIYVRSNTGQGNWVADPITTPLKVEPTNISKINTGLQFLTLSIGLLQPIFTLVPPEVLISLCWLTGGTTIASIYSYGSMSAFTNSGNTDTTSNDSATVSRRIKEKAEALLRRTKSKSMKDLPK